MSKAKMDAARELIAEKRYDEARMLLKTMKDADAKHLLKTIDGLPNNVIATSVQSEKTLTEWVEKEKLIHGVISVLAIAMGVYLLFALPIMKSTQSATSYPLVPVTSPWDPIVALLPYVAIVGGIYGLWYTQQEDRIRHKLLKFKPAELRRNSKLFLGIGLCSLAFAVLIPNKLFPVLPFLTALILLANYPLSRWRAQQAEKL